jgi:MFS family permease
VGILHAFTHLYQVALLPLYLPIRDELHLRSVEQATGLMTVMMMAYYLPSYPVGVLADRLSRKSLLAWGLFLNGLGFVGLGLSTQYSVALASVVVAGFGGSCFHPAATALVAGLNPTRTGKALGLIAIGASVGFLSGPLLSGRMMEAFGSWRVPIVTMGAAGVLMSGVFALLAREAPRTTVSHRERVPLFPRRIFGWVFAAMAFFFCCRDFAGNSLGTLGSLFLQNAHGMSPGKAGTVLSCIFVASAVSNPLFGHWSDRRRFPWIVGLVGLSAALFAAFPWLPAAGIPWAFGLYGALFVASYPIVEAELMQCVPDAARGRFFGLFITVGGMGGNLSHWAAGASVDAMGQSAHHAESYRILFGGLAALMGVSLLALPALAWFRHHRREYPSA